MIDPDLSRLYTATSLMQIDDNIMRYVERQISESHSSQCCFDIVDCVFESPYLYLYLALTGMFINLSVVRIMKYLWCIWRFLFLWFQQKIPRPQLSQRVLWEGELCTLYSQCKISFCVHLTSSHLMFLFLVCLCICLMYEFLFPGKGATAASELCRWSSGSWLTAHHPSHTSRWPTAHVLTTAAVPNRSVKKILTSYFSLVHLGNHKVHFWDSYDLLLAIYLVTWHWIMAHIWLCTVQLCTWVCQAVDVPADRSWHIFAVDALFSF